jgi:hypothetical protein
MEIEIPMPPLEAASPVSTVEQRIHTDEVMDKIAEYIRVIFERFRREGNYANTLRNSPDRDFEGTLFPPTEIGHAFEISTGLVLRDGECRYSIRLGVLIGQSLKFVRRLEVWNHHIDQDEVEFHYTPTELFDTITLFRRTVRRWIRYAPFRVCASPDCDMLLLPTDRAHCFECHQIVRSVMCGICLDESVKCVLRTSCNHEFHRECFHRILHHEPGFVKCPLCRTLVRAVNGK